MRPAYNRADKSEGHRWLVHALSRNKGAGATQKAHREIDSPKKEEERLAHGCRSVARATLAGTGKLGRADGGACVCFCFVWACCG